VPARLFLFALVFLAASVSARAQADTAQHRAAYAKINAALPQMEKVTATHRDDPIEFALTGWLQDGEVKKIVATNNTDEGEEEYYLEHEEPLFVFNTYRAGAGRGPKIEERYYFREGRLFQWLTTEKPAPVFHREDYQATTERLLGNTRAFVAALKKGKTSDQKAIATHVVEGTFLGIEQGDYAHWQMRTKAGKDVSFFILGVDPTVEKVIDRPAAYRRRACRVTWKKNAANLPEAGGTMEVEQIVSVEWLGKK